MTDSPRRAGLAPPPAGTTELGIDIINVDRIRNALARHGRRFPKRILTPAEDAYVRDRPENLAGRWAAKEAVSKVLGLGVRGVGWREIEIVRLPTGQPTVRLHDRALRARPAAGHGADRGIDQPRARVRGRDRVWHPHRGWRVRLPARHRGPPRRSRAGHPRADGAAPRACTRRPSPPNGSSARRTPRRGDALSDDAREGA